MLFSELQNIELFKGLDENQLQCDVKGEAVSLKKGEILFKEGDPAPHFYVVLDGTLKLYRVIKGQTLPVNDFTKGMTAGEVPLLSGTPHLATAEAVTDVRIFRICSQDFWTMLGNCELVRERILKDMAERRAQLDLMSYQREKLVSLGTMSAGLAHELNNPAAAAKRASQNLHSTLQEFDKHSTEILKNFLFKNPPDDGVYPFQPIVDMRKLDGVKLDTIEKSDLEDEMTDWLESLGIEEPWKLASSLVGVGYTRDILKNFSEQLVPNQVNNFLNWVHKEVELQLLSNELMHSTTRISDLITAMKSYSYMDQNMEKVEVDVHEGLNNTLIILNHKLKGKNAEVLKEYGENIPKVMAFGSELNQVWTNILDNAIDALPEKGGKITIKTYVDVRDTNMVSVEIIDNGKGIPEDIQSKVFEPFFTTKGVGQGTGIGLDISYRIITNQHNGTLRVQSKPGETIFKTCLPIRF